MLKGAVTMLQPAQIGSCELHKSITYDRLSALWYGSSRDSIIEQILADKRVDRGGLSWWISQAYLVWDGTLLCVSPSDLGTTSHLPLSTVFITHIHIHLDSDLITHHTHQQNTSINPLYPIQTAQSQWKHPHAQHKTWGWNLRSACFN